LDVFDGGIELAGRLAEVIHESPEPSVAGHRAFNGRAAVDVREENTSRPARRHVVEWEN
jgi:hypothetical protein